MAGTEYLNGGQHVVQFYGRDRELAERVAGFLLEALQRGGVAVVIATEEHRRAFEARLAQAGADLAAARESGTWLTLDANVTADKLMAAGRLDQAAFDRTLGDLIRRAGHGGRPVRAYGELVALLWDRGLVNTAVELEAMWDDLARRQPSFSLFCGYRADSVTNDGSLNAFAEVCRLHRSVIGGWPAPAAPALATRSFALSGDAPAAARHFATDAVRRLGAADLADDVALVVTELAANAIVHAQTGFMVHLAVDAGVLRISVRDASPLAPGEADSALLPMPLHGLGAVDALASRWGVQSLGHSGKSVWVELRR